MADFASNEQADIVVIGSFVVGITTRLPRFPFPGESLVADLFDLGPGGKGSNFAVAVARQNLRVSPAVKVGNDMFADLLTDLYMREGIDRRFVHRSGGEKTAVGLVYLTEDGENTIGLYPGANMSLTPEEALEAVEGNPNARVLMTQLESPDETIRACVARARALGMTVILNPAPARKIDPINLKAVDILTPNRGEAMALCGWSPGDAAVDIDELGERLLETGIPTVVITLGRDGARVFRANASPASVPAYPVTPVDSVGAGDAFNGGLAAGLAEGDSIESSLRRAAVTGALATTGVGAVAALPSREEVFRRLSAWKPDIA